MPVCICSYPCGTPCAYTWFDWVSLGELFNDVAFSTDTELIVALPNSSKGGRHVYFFFRIFGPFNLYPVKVSISQAPKRKTARKLFFSFLFIIIFSFKKFKKEKKIFLLKIMHSKVKFPRKPFSHLDKYEIILHNTFSRILRHCIACSDTKKLFEKTWI